MRMMNLAQAICEAVDEEMARDENVCLLGEDVGVFGGVWGTYPRLQTKYGERRVWDTPLSESAIVGTAAGAAMCGLRPIAEIMYFDFVTCAMDPMINQIPKARFMSGNQLTLPLTIIGQFGSGSSEAAQHSQSLEAWFIHTPGWKVVMPSSVYDTKGLLKSTIRDNNPVVFLWNRSLYEVKEEVPDGEWIVPLSQANVVREGTDITVVATSFMVSQTQKAIESLGDEISVELIDPRTVQPLDVRTILESVEKTGRLLVVHEAPAICGFGAEVVRQVVYHSFDYLDAQPVVLGAMHVPMPFAENLERTVVPQPKDIAEKIREIVPARAGSYV